MSGVRRSDNSDEAAAFFARQSRLRLRSQQALEDGRRNAAQYAPKPDLRTQALAALDRVDRTLAAISCTREFAARRTRIKSLQGDIRQAGTSKRSQQLLTLRNLLVASNNMLRELSGTALTADHGPRLREARIAVTSALDRLPGSSARLTGRE